MITLTRRTLVQGSIAAGAESLFTAADPRGQPRPRQLPSGAPPLDPLTIPKYVEPLVIPPAMPQAPRERRPAGLSAETDYYEIAVRQFQQPILPASLGLQTTVWSYGAIDWPDSFNYPAFTIEATVDRPVRVAWINELVDANGDFLPHLLPVDPTLHWANPGGGTTARDSRPGSRRRRARTPGRCRSWSTCTAGTTREESDGYHRGLVPARGPQPPGRLCAGRHVLRRVRGQVRRRSGARCGSRGRRSSSTPTTSGRPPSGSTTTPWA